MKTNFLQSLLYFVSILFIATGCTSSNDQEVTNADIIAAQSVFATGTLAASNLDSDDIIAFDGNNRPIMPGENCPDPTNPGDDDDDGNTPPTPITCQPGFELQGDDCVAICKENQVFAQGQCYDKEKSCDIENGEGMQAWMASSYGNCVPTKCEDAYEISGEMCAAKCSDDEVYHNGECLPKVADCRSQGRKGVKNWMDDDDAYGKCHVAKDCTVKHGSGMKDFDIETMKYGKCEVTDCKYGFKKKGNKCVARCSKSEVFNGKKCLPERKKCDVAGGEGERKWSHEKKRYGWCRVTRCDRGFVRAGNSCRRPWDNRREDADPLIVDLGADTMNPQGITLSSQIEGILFDILGLNSAPQAHAKKQISWTDQQRYQWVVKPNANGQVLGINEMFGDNTLGPDGQFAAEGFEALSKYDIDKNGKIDTEDPVYLELSLWHDANRNGQSDPGELTSFSAAGIESIDLNFDPNFFEVDQYGNKTSFKSVVKFFDGRTTLVFDLWFKYFEPAADPTDPADPNPTPGECPAPDMMANPSPDDDSL